MEEKNFIQIITKEEVTSKYHHKYKTNKYKICTYCHWISNWL